MSASTSTISATSLLPTDPLWLDVDPPTEAAVATVATGGAFFVSFPPFQCREWPFDLQCEVFCVPVMPRRAKFRRGGSPFQSRFFYRFRGSLVCFFKGQGKGAGSLHFFRGVTTRNFRLHLFSPSTGVSLRKTNYVVYVCVARFVSCLVSILVHRHGPLNLACANDFPCGLLVLLHFRQVSTRLPGNVVVGDDRRVGNAIRSVLSPSFRLSVPLVLVIGVHAFRSPYRFYGFLLLPFVHVFCSGAGPHGHVLLKGKGVLVNGDRHVSRQVRGHSLAGRATSIFSQIRAVRRQGSRYVVHSRIPSAFTRLHREVVFCASGGVVLLSRVLG